MLLFLSRKVLFYVRFSSCNECLRLLLTTCFHQTKCKQLTHHKAELVIVDGVLAALDDLGLELHVGAGHQVDPHVGVALAYQVGLLEVLAFHHRGVQLLGLGVIANLDK